MEAKVKKRRLIPGVGYADEKITSTPTEWSTKLKKADPEIARVGAVWELMARLGLRLEHLT
jgi:hypothetical protein